MYGGAPRRLVLGDYLRDPARPASGEPDWVEGASRCGKPGDVLAVINGYKGRIDEAIVHYERQVELARMAADPPRLNWALFHLAMCRAAIHDPLAGRLAEEALAVARDSAATPPPCRAARRRPGSAAQGPGRRAGAAGREREAAASVSNRWFYAFARMYAAATHGMHPILVMAATAFLECSTSGTGWATGASSG